MKWFLENICTMDWNEQMDDGKLIKDATNEKIKEFPQYEHLIRMYYDKKFNLFNHLSFCTSFINCFKFTIYA